MGTKSFGWKETIRVLVAFDFEFKRQRGSHITMRKEDEFPLSVTFPKQNEFKKGFRADLVKHVGIPIEYFENPKLAKKESCCNHSSLSPR